MKRFQNLFLLFIAFTAHTGFTQTLPKLDPNKKTVCSISFTSSLQVQAFRDHLIKHKEISKYQFVELSDLYNIKDSYVKNDDWFEDACKSQLSCDVLFITGHFGGSFFGDKFGGDLEAGILRKMSCQNKCKGVLGDPLEIYLFGCNTLADKTPDQRTPEQYFNVLREHGSLPMDALHSVNQRYSISGESFKEHMTATFKGRKKLYGFNAPAPSSPRTTPPFKSYLNHLGSYDKHFDKVATQRLKATVENADKSFKKIMSGVADECYSKASDDPHLKSLCSLLYGPGTVEGKMDIVLEFFEKDPVKNLGTINQFLSATPEVKETSGYKLLQSNEVLKRQLIGAMQSKTDLGLSREAILAVHNLNLLPKEEIQLIASQKLQEAFGESEYRLEIMQDVCLLVGCHLDYVKDPKKFETMILPSNTTLSKEVEISLGKLLDTTDVRSRNKISDAINRLEKPGEELFKKVDEFIPDEYSQRDWSNENISYYFYQDQPMSDKALKYYLSAVQHPKQGKNFVGIFEKQLSEKEKSGLKEILPKILVPETQKALEAILNPKDPKDGE